MAKIYVASSWRNQHQPQVVSFLREQGHEVYDFRHPAGKTGFQWSQIDENWENWSTDQYRAALEHPIAQAGFKSDFDAMQWAEAEETGSSTYPGMIYEQGIKAAIEWLVGDINDHPINE